MGGSGFEDYRGSYSLVDNDGSRTEFNGFLVVIFGFIFRNFGHYNVIFVGFSFFSIGFVEAFSHDLMLFFVVELLVDVFEGGKDGGVHLFARYRVDQERGRRTFNLL